MKIVACDIGKVNFALCCVEHEGAFEGGLSLLNCEAAAACGRLRVRHWENTRLVTQKRPALAQTLQGVVDLVRSREALFAQADLVLIESQMTALMKAISAALFGALRTRFPALRVGFQHGGVKLSFGDLQSALGAPVRVDAYAARKRAAVQAARHFCQHCPAAAALLAGAKKADDLADALLHALAGLALHGQTSAQRGARTKRTLSEVEQPSA